TVMGTQWTANNGGVEFNQGSATNSGLVAFRNNAGTRIGYIGNVSQANFIIGYVAEGAGGYHNFTSTNSDGQPSRFTFANNRMAAISTGAVNQAVLYATDTDTRVYSTAAVPFYLGSGNTTRIELAPDGTYFRPNVSASLSLGQAGRLWNGVWTVTPEA